MSISPVPIKGKKILITGPASQVAMPLVERWATEAEVWGLARFSDASVRAQVEATGARVLALDLTDVRAFAEIPDDFDYVLNFAVLKSGDFARDFAVNADGVGHLMSRCASASAFLHCSSTAVYEYAGPEPLSEDAKLGDNHRSLFPTYSLSKIAGESVARVSAREFQVPTVIARLNVPYGDNGGWPFYHLLTMESGGAIDIHPERPNRYSPIHADDYIEQIPLLLAAASVEPMTVNFGGSQAVSVEEWCAYIGALTGFEARFNETRAAFGSLVIDDTRLRAITGGSSRIDWRVGVRRMIENLRPDLLRRAD